MANVKYCPMCRKQVSIDTEVCECGYEFSVVNEPETNAFEEFDKVWRGSECKKCQRRKFCIDPIA